MSGLWERLRQGVGMGEAPETTDVEEQSLMQQWNEASTLNRTQRAVGFAFCAGLGLLLALLAPMFVLRPTKFAVVYTLGNLLSIGR